MKTVFITGGSAGIGLELCKLYQARGYQVGTCSFEEENKVSLPDGIDYFQVDVTNAEQLKASLKEFVKKYKRLDLVIANAGIRMDKATIPDFKFGTKVIDVNVNGVLNTFGPSLEIMNKQGFGHIVAIASISGMTGMPGMAIYGASKSAVINMCESFAIDLKKHNIDVTAVAPGFIRTEQVARNNHSMPFMLTPSEAAEKIYNAIKKKKGLYVFPFPMMIIAKFLYFLPRSLYKKIMQHDLLGMQKG